MSQKQAVLSQRLPRQQKNPQNSKHSHRFRSFLSRGGSTATENGNETGMLRALTVAEKLLVGGWPFKEEDLDLSVQRGKKTLRTILGKNEREKIS